MSIVLPHAYYARRAWLRSFWLVMSLGAGVLAGMLLWTLPLLERVAAGVALGTAVAVPGLVRPRIAVLPMRTWNRAARMVADAAAAWMTRVCFYVVIRALGRMGSSLRLAQPQPGESLWTPWKDGGAGMAPAGASHQVWADVTGWGRRSGNTWIWGLLPFLYLLSLLAPPAEAEAPPPGIYTLY